jgi:phage gp29-like protein
MSASSRELAALFFAATRALACHTGSLQERLADTYADHLLQVVAHDLPSELQPAFRELEERLNAVDESEADDPFRAATQRLSDAEARELIDRILALSWRLAGLQPR